MVQRSFCVYYIYLLIQSYGSKIFQFQKITENSKRAEYLASSIHLINILTMLYNLLHYKSIYLVYTSDPIFTSTESF